MLMPIRMVRFYIKLANKLRVPPALPGDTYYPRFLSKIAGRLHNPGWQLLDADHPGNLESFARCFTLFRQ
jgi:hypothetical protein